MEAEEAGGTREAAGEAGRRRPGRHTCEPEAGSGRPDTGWAPGWQRPAKGRAVGVHGAAGIRGSGDAEANASCVVWDPGGGRGRARPPEAALAGREGRPARARRAAGAVGSFKVSFRN